jgi:hypothetical protein
VTGWRIRIGKWVSKETLSAEEAVRRRQKLKSCFIDIEVILEQEV